MSSTFPNALRPADPVRDTLRSTPTRLWMSAAIVMLGLTLGACGGSGDAGGAVRAPSSAGEVWEADRPDDRTTAPGAMLAFVNGMDGMVVDGDDIYAGMTPLHAVDGSGGKTVALSNGLTAQLVPTGDVMTLRFSSGETLLLRKRVVQEGK